MCDEDEALLRYHFGDLAPAEREALQRRLSEEPELACRLEELEACLASNEPAPPAAEREADAAPGLLADKTVEAILSPSTDAPCETSFASRKRFSLAEAAAIGVVAGLLGMLLIPALQTSREVARRTACSQNLQELGKALLLYSQDHGDSFPRIEPGMNAGMFTVSLVDGGYLRQDEAQHALLCPSSELANLVAERRAAVRVPTSAELQAAALLELDRLRRLMAGSYAYRFGHLENGLYVYPRSQADSRAALTADAPVRADSGGMVSRNHGACGQNVLFQDGHVAFQSSCWSPCIQDHLYLNDAGEVAAGRGPLDVVLAPSEATPGVVPAMRVGF